MLTGFGGAIKIESTSRSAAGVFAGILAGRRSSSLAAEPSLLISASPKQALFYLCLTFLGNWHIANLELITKGAHYARE
jgi:hypothetical protein